MDLAGCIYIFVHIYTYIYICIYTHICINIHVYFSNDNKKGAINWRVGVMGEGGGRVPGGAEEEMKGEKMMYLYSNYLKQTFI